jgi:hypothetical protein
MLNVFIILTQNWQEEKKPFQEKKEVLTYGMGLWTKN